LKIFKLINQSRVILAENNRSR